MRSQRFEVADADLHDEYAFEVDIYVMTDGGQDEWGDEDPPSKEYYSQNQLVDIQAKNGVKRAAESGTVYESTHLMFHPVTEREISQGAAVEVRLIGIPGVHETYSVVFVANRGSHLEIDLNRVRA
mgnify:CR=1 FL=1